MRVLSVDPGSEKSGWCVLQDGVPVEWGWDDNDYMLEAMEFTFQPATHLAIEYVYLRGMKIYQQTVDTVFWVGRFAEAWGGPFTLIDRKDVKMTLCGNASADDASIRIAIIDRVGGPDKAIGGRKCQTCHGKGLRGRGKKRGTCSGCHCVGNNGILRVDETSNGPYPVGIGCGYETHPGPLHGVSGHVWSAISVGLTYEAQQE